MEREVAVLAPGEEETSYTPEPFVSSALGRADWCGVDKEKKVAVTGNFGEAVSSSRRGAAKAISGVAQGLPEASSIIPLEPGWFDE